MLTYIKESTSLQTVSKLAQNFIHNIVALVHTEYIIDFCFCFYAPPLVTLCCFKIRSSEENVINFLWALLTGWLVRLQDARNNTCNVHCYLFYYSCIVNSKFSSKLASNCRL
jgi:hypothetical protein